MDKLTSPLFLIAAGMVVLASVLGLLMRSSSKGFRRVRAGRVTGVVGRKGHGKTLFATHEMLRTIGTRQFCAKCSDEQGRKVFHRATIASNGTLKVPAGKEAYYVHLDSFDDIATVGADGKPEVHLPHMTFVVIDEAHLRGWFPAQAGTMLPAIVQWYLSQCRKPVHEVMWVTQHETRCSAGLKVLTDEMGLCTKGSFKAMKVRFWEPENFRRMAGPKPLKPDWTFRYRVTRRVAAAYNTYELLMPDLDQLAPARKKPAAAEGRGRAGETVPLAWIERASRDGADPADKDEALTA